MMSSLYLFRYKTSLFFFLRNKINENLYLLNKTDLDCSERQKQINMVHITGIISEGGGWGWLGVGGGEVENIPSAELAK